MIRTRRSDRFVPRSTWTTLNCRLLAALTTIAVLAATASLLALSAGAHDGIVPIAVATVGAFVVGLALVRLVTYLEANGVPVLESPSSFDSGALEAGSGT